MFLDGVDFRGAVATLVGEQVRAPHQAPPASVASSSPDDDDRAQVHRALALWHEAEPLAGTLAETYLHRRGLLIPDRVAESLRFHARCPFGEGGTRHPCLVSLWRDIISDEPRAIQRTPLTATGDRMSRRLTLGPTRGAAIKLSPDDEVSIALTIGEGLETVLAGMMKGFTPAWALGSWSGIANFSVLPGVECLRIAVDNDAPDPKTGRRPGPDATTICENHWRAAGRDVWFAVPNELGQDMADVIKGAAA
jgi:hypothetical protein